MLLQVSEQQCDSASNRHSTVDGLSPICPPKLATTRSTATSPSTLRYDPQVKGSPQPPQTCASRTPRVVRETFTARAATSWVASSSLSSDPDHSWALHARQPQTPRPKRSGPGHGRAESPLTDGAALHRSAVSLSPQGQRKGVSPPSLLRPSHSASASSPAAVDAETLDRRWLLSSPSSHPANGSSLRPPTRGAHSEDGGQRSPAALLPFSAASGGTGQTSAAVVGRVVSPSGTTVAVLAYAYHESPYFRRLIERSGEELEWAPPQQESRRAGIVSLVCTQGGLLSQRECEARAATEAEEAAARANMLLSIGSTKGERSGGAPNRRRPSATAAVDGAPERSRRREADAEAPSPTPRSSPWVLQPMAEAGHVKGGFPTAARVRLAGCEVAMEDFFSSSLARVISAAREAPLVEGGDEGDGRREDAEWAKPKQVIREGTPPVGHKRRRPRRAAPATTGVRHERADAEEATSDGVPPLGLPLCLSLSSGAGSGDTKEGSADTNAGEGRDGGSEAAAASTRGSAKPSRTEAIHREPPGSEGEVDSGEGGEDADAAAPRPVRDAVAREGVRNVRRKDRSGERPKEAEREATAGAALSGEVLRELLEEEEDGRYLLTGECPPAAVFRRWTERFLQDSGSYDANPKAVRRGHGAAPSGQGRRPALKSPLSQKRGVQSPPLHHPGTYQRRGPSVSSGARARSSSAVSSTGMGDQDRGEGRTRQQPLFDATGGREGSRRGSSPRSLSCFHTAREEEGFAALAVGSGESATDQRPPSIAPSAYSFGGDDADNGAGADNGGGVASVGGEGSLSGDGAYLTIPDWALRSSSGGGPLGSEDGVEVVGSVLRADWGGATSASSSYRRSPSHPLVVEASEKVRGSAASVRDLEVPSGSSYLSPAGSERDARMTLYEVFGEGLLQIVAQEEGDAASY